MEWFSLSFGVFSRIQLLTDYQSRTLSFEVEVSGFLVGFFCEMRMNWLLEKEELGHLVTLPVAAVEPRFW